ncbi:hypothetical protein [Pleionea sediminis]|uniref:hypothetical protein n=1 Tax=Pleionea sediminis TaxID=2569479 RepID=UPI001186B5C4|nr:hypothetical protein [Pleionea sediminis]
MRVIGLILLSFSLAGCVQFKVVPDNAIRDSIDAGKSVYHEYKGGTKRNLSKQVLINDYASKKLAEDECIRELKESIASESTEKDPAIISMKSKYVNDNQSIECTIVAYVWPKEE